MHSINYDLNKCFPSSLAPHALNERCLLAGEISFKSLLPYNKNKFPLKALLYVYHKTSKCHVFNDKVKWDNCERAANTPVSH